MYVNFAVAVTVWFKLRMCIIHACILYARLKVILCVSVFQPVFRGTEGFRERQAGVPPVASKK